MTDVALKTAAPAANSQDITVEELFPHAPATIWRTLTDGQLISRWILMPLTGFAAVVGQRFTLQTTPAGPWDGLIRCEVLEVRPNERLVYAWRSGHEGNVGYGARLDTIVTWTLSPAPGGTRLRLVHSGFVMPRNETAYTGMSEGWRKVVHNLDAVSTACSLH